jgi:hypothetical protein
MPIDHKYKIYSPLILYTQLSYPTRLITIEYFSYLESKIGINSKYDEDIHEKSFDE